MKTRILKLAAIILVMAVVGGLNAQVITEVGTEYLLEHNLSNGGIIIEADSVVFDGQNQRIKGNGRGVGILVKANYVTVKNCEVRDFGKGISVTGKGNTISCNDVSQNIAAGIYLVFCDSSEVSDNNTSDCNGFGIHLHRSSNNSIIFNTSNNNYQGIRIFARSNYNNISNNDVSGNAHGDGVYIGLTSDWDASTGNYGCYNGPDNCYNGDRGGNHVNGWSSLGGDLCKVRYGDGEFDPKIYFTNVTENSVTVNVDMRGDVLYVYRWDNAGTDWLQIAVVEATKSWTDTELAPGTKYLYFVKLALEDVGVFETPIDSVTTLAATGIADNNNYPENFFLSQNFPNPFNPTTTISYNLPHPCNVKLTVFDVQGRQVANLVNETQVPGIYSVYWNAADFPGGPYFYKFQAGEFQEVKKMTLIK